MQRQHFETQLKRLASTYGAQSYPPERVKIIWDTFCGASDEVFSAAISAVIASERMPPMMPALRQAVADAASVLRPQFPQRAVSCHRCQDAGSVTAQNADGLRFAAPCDCAAGDPFRDAVQANAHRRSAADGPLRDTVWDEELARPVPKGKK